MGANTTYYARIPYLTWKWVEVNALVAQDVWEKYPMASDVLHQSEYENRTDNE